MQASKSLLLRLVYGQRTHPIEDTEREETVSSQRGFGPDRQADLDQGWDFDGEMLGANVAPLFPNQRLPDQLLLGRRPTTLSRLPIVLRPWHLHRVMQSGILVLTS